MQKNKRKEFPLSFALVTVLLLIIVGATWATVGRNNITVLFPRAQLADSGSSSTSDIYLAQGALGTGSGSDCTDARSASWFNNASNWGTGTGQIGPGTTVHLCGTITGSVSSTGLTFQGSGTSGNPITLLFESGANLTSPAWGEAIYTNGQSWIVINGGTNGVIQNTANGSGLANNIKSEGVDVAGSNITVENLTVADICQHTSHNDTVGCQTDDFPDGGIEIDNPSGTPDANITITKNAVHDSFSCVYYNPASTDSNIVISDNTISRCNWGIASAGPMSPTGSLTISGNDVSCVVGGVCNWDDSADAFHHNGIHLFPQDASMYNVTIADNYFHDINGDTSGYIFMDPGGTGDVPSYLIYNNVFYTTPGQSGPSNGMIATGGSKGRIFNNTMYGPAGGGFGVNIWASTTMENNISDGPYYAESPYSDLTVYGLGLVTGVVSDYNDMINNAGGWATCVAGGSCSIVGTLSDWQQLTKSMCSGGCDTTGSTVGDPDLNTDFSLRSGSAAIGTGVNLTPLGISGLDVGAPQYFGLDYACGDGCVARPSTGPWDMGAYPSGSSGVSETQYTITATAGTGGSITPSGAVSVDSGSSQTFTVIPNSGYSISSLIVDNVSISTSTSYTFPNVTTDHTISAAFSSTADTQAPTVSAFSIPSTSSTSTVPIISFIATDNVGVTAYLVTTTGSTPSASAPGWTSSAPSSYTVPSAGTYTLYAWAKDAAGNVSSSLSATVTVTIVTVPGAPTGVSARAGNGQATVSFSAPGSNGGSSITGYTVSSNPAGGTDSNAGSTALSHTVIGLDNGTSYNFTVTAANSAGIGTASSPSNSVIASTTPSIATSAASPIGTSTATLNALISSNGGASVTLSGFAYGTSPSLVSGVSTTTEGSQGTGDFSQNLTGLSPSTTYYARAYAVNAVGTSYGSIVSFTTSAQNATVYALSYTAGPNGSLTGSTTQAISAGSSGSAVTAAPSAGYAFSSWSDGSTANPRADSDVEENVSVTASFVALAALPSVTADSPTSIAQTSVVLNGSLVTSGNASSTVEGFNYGLTTSYGSTASTAGTFGLGSFSQALSGLSCGNTYHDEAFSTNPAGTASSVDQTFTTLACSSSGGGGGGGGVTYSGGGGGSYSSGGGGGSSGLTTIGTSTCSSSLPSFVYALTIGSTGSEITDLQDFLYLAGYTKAQYITGYFGPITEAALAAYFAANPKADCPSTATSTPATNCPSGYACVPFSTTSPAIPLFTRTLNTGDSGLDVRYLQEFLNTHHFTVAQSGPGSSGDESEYYGPVTAAAVKRFQNAYAPQILWQYGLSTGTGVFGSATLKEVNAILKQGE